MRENSEYARRYTLVFMPSSLKRWWMKFLDERFGHVAILRKSDSKKSWLLNDAVGGNIIIDDFPVVDLRQIYKGCTIIDVWSLPRTYPSMKIAHLNCVEMVKLVLGIKKFWIFTPYQLYKYIMDEKQKEHQALKHEG